MLYLLSKLGGDAMETLLWRLHDIVDRQFRLRVSKQRQHVVTMTPNLFPQGKRLQELDI